MYFLSFFTEMSSSQAAIKTTKKPRYSDNSLDGEINEYPDHSEVVIKGPHNILQIQAKILTPKGRYEKTIQSQGQSVQLFTPFTSRCKPNQKEADLINLWKATQTDRKCNGRHSTAAEARKCTGASRPFTPGWIPWPTLLSDDKKRSKSSSDSRRTHSTQGRRRNNPWQDTSAPPSMEKRSSMPRRELPPAVARNNRRPKIVREVHRQGTTSFELVSGASPESDIEVHPVPANQNPVVEAEVSRGLRFDQFFSSGRAPTYILRKIYTICGQDIDLAQIFMDTILSDASSQQVEKYIQQLSQASYSFDKEIEECIRIQQVKEAQHIGSVYSREKLLELSLPAMRRTFNLCQEMRKDMEETLTAVKDFALEEKDLVNTFKTTIEKQMAQPQAQPTTFVEEQPQAKPCPIHPMPIVIKPEPQEEDKSVFNPEEWPQISDTSSSDIEREVAEAMVELSNSSESPISELTNITYNLNL